MQQLEATREQHGAASREAYTSILTQMTTGRVYSIYANPQDSASQTPGIQEGKFTIGHGIATTDEPKERWTTYLYQPAGAARSPTVEYTEVPN